MFGTYLKSTCFGFSLSTDSHRMFWEEGYGNMLILEPGTT